MKRTIKESMILCKLNKIENLQSNLSKEREGADVWDEEADIPTDANGIQRLTGAHSGNLDSNNLGNAGERTHYQYVTKQTKRLLTSNKIEIAIKTLSIKSKSTYR